MIFVGAVAAEQSAGPLPRTGDVALVEESDVLTTVARLAIKGAFVSTEANDTIIATAVPPRTASLTVTQDSDTLTAIGMKLVPINGVLDKVDDGDSIAATGAELAPIVGVFGVSEAADTLVATIEQVLPIHGVVNATEAGDSLVATGVSAVAITGTLSITEQDDTVAGVSSTQTTIWDAANKSSSITLGRSAVVATTNANNGTWKAVRATTSKSSGKAYLEFIAGYLGNNGNIFGFGNASLNTASFVGSDANSFGYQSQGSVQGISGSWQGLTKMGEVVQIAIDLTNKLIWARTDRSTNWNNSGTADPATGTGGKSYTTTGALFPACSILDDSGLNTVVINSGAFVFSGSIPSGFTAWDVGVPVGVLNTTATTWDPATKNTNIVLTGSNLTATQNSATNTWCSVRSTTSNNYGRVYFEQTIVALDGVAGIIAGIADSTFPVATTGNYVGIDGHSTGVQVVLSSVGWQFIASNGSGQPSFQTFSVGQVMGFAVDLNRGLIWVKNVTAGGNWNNDAAADPVAGTRGAAIDFSGPAYIAAGMFRNGGSSDALTLNTGPTGFTGTVPTGYVGWDS